MQYIFTLPGVRVFLSERVSQDSLEIFFGTQQQRGHTNENPNMRDFCHNTQALRVINTMCVDVARGNYWGKRMVDMDTHTHMTHNIYHDIYIDTHTCIHIHIYIYIYDHISGGFCTAVR